MKKKDTTNQDAEKKPADSATVRGMHLQVRLPEKTFAGSPVQVSIQLTNNETEDVIWGEINGYRELGLVVLDPAGVPCPRTKFGKRVLPDGIDAMILGRYIATRLAPGTTQAWDIDLNKVYRLVPAKYTLSVSISVRYNENDGIRIGVKDLPFRVLPAE